MEKTKYDMETINRTCRHCKMFDTVRNMVAGQETTVCRAHPPTMIATLTMSGTPQAPQPLWMANVLWAQVLPTDWCGEFQRKLEGVN